MAQGNFQRRTRQREAILHELRTLTSHPTAVGLFQILRKRLPKISLGTVYRNLELLVQMGMVRKLEFTGAEARFDGNLPPHDHVRCIRCGKVDDIEGPPLELSQCAYHDCKGYEILDHHLELLGICPRCKRHDDK